MYFVTNAEPWKRIWSEQSGKQDSFNALLG